MRTQLARDARPFPTLSLKPADSLFDYTYEHLLLDGYDPHPRINAPVAV